MYKVAVIGAAGFTGAELVRLILAHPEFELVAASSESDAGKPLAAVYPFFAGRTELSFVSHEDALSTEHATHLVFLAVPHTAAMKIAPQLMNRGMAVIDLSADFRLQDKATYEHWYNTTHTAPELLNTAVYGMPEVYRDKLTALAGRYKEGESVLVANPGCYPTASTLAVLPMLKARWFNWEDVAVINAISGVSGAGRKATETTQFCLANESINAYGVTTHRHTPEIMQTLSHLAGNEVKVQFTPHLAPLNRGMVATAVLPVREVVPCTSTEMVHQLYQDVYAREPFVQVLPLGTMPKSGSVTNSNYAQVGVAYDSSTHRVVASCAIDNLGKGAAAQAVQCANILCALGETTGLKDQGGLL